MNARVLIIGPTPPPYHGVSVATGNVLTSLTQSANGFRVLHLDTADRRDISNIGRVDWQNIWLAGKHAARFLLFLLRKRPDVVYVPISQATLPFLRDCLFLFPARWTKTKTVVHLHGSYFRTFYESSPRWMQWIARNALRHVACAIVLGEGLRDRFAGILPPERVQVVPNGIPDLFAGGRNGSRRGGPKRVLLLSSLMPEKGLHLLLEAIPRVLTATSNVKFVLAGPWYREADRRHTLAFLRRYGLEGHVEMNGPVGPEQKRALLESADVFVLPTFNEGHPISILEAMCAHLPVIGTRVGCIPETLRDGHNGFLINPRPDELAERLCQLLRDDALRARMGQASREMFLSSYTLPVFQDRLLRVFHRVLEETAR